MVGIIRSEVILISQVFQDSNSSRTQNVPKVLVRAYVCQRKLVLLKWLETERPLRPRLRWDIVIHPHAQNSQNRGWFFTGNLPHCSHDPTGVWPWTSFFTCAKTVRVSNQNLVVSSPAEKGCHCTHLLGGLLFGTQREQNYITLIWHQFWCLVLFDLVSWLWKTTILLACPDTVKGPLQTVTWELRLPWNCGRTGEVLCQVGIISWCSTSWFVLTHAPWFFQYILFKKHCNGQQTHQANDNPRKS